MGPILPWWGWLICGVAGTALGLLLSDVRHTEAPLPRIFIGFVFILAGVVGFASAIVGFVQWVWAAS